MHPKFLSFRYKLFTYRHIEHALAAQPQMQCMLDIGCGDGENLHRFADLPLARFGMEVSWPRLRHARHKLQLPVVQALGEKLPYPDGSFDLIYVAHVLHHVAAYEELLEEARRCLTPHGRLFIVETVTDHPILRLARAIHPFWHGDVVEANWHFSELSEILEKAGFTIAQSGRYNIVFWLWEILPLAFWPFELFTPLFVYLDLFLARWLRPYAVHAYFVLQPIAEVNPL